MTAFVLTDKHGNYFDGDGVTHKSEEAQRYESMMAATIDALFLGLEHYEPVEVYDVDPE